MKAFHDEELETELIAYHLGELSRWRAMKMRRRLERDPELAAESEEIASTLRAFCCDAAPAVSEAMVGRSWERVRGSLGVLEAPQRSNKGWGWTVGVAVAVILLAVVANVPGSKTGRPPVQTASGQVAAEKSWSRRLVDELRRHKTTAAPYNNHPGPLTTEPVDAVAEDPALAAHLDTAERVLTEVSHTDGPLPQDTREQVHRLLLENAVYHQSAAQHGDMATAGVIDDLGRVLISLDAEPTLAETKQNPDAFRLQMNLGGVLLDLRILHHNDKPSVGQ